MTTSADLWGDAAEPLSPQQILFRFDGRIGRRTWWLWGVLALVAASAIGFALLRIAGVAPGTADGIVNLLLLWPMLAVWVKRWHDRDKSGWWVLINVVPVIGLLWTLVENGLLPGTPGRNRFGEPEAA